MADFDELKKLLILKLYERANDPNATRELSQQGIMGLLKEQTGAGIATQVYSELFLDGLLRDTRVPYGGGGRIKITAKLIRLAEQLIRPTHADDKTIKYTEFRDHLLVALAKEEEESGVDFFDLVVVAEKNSLQYKDGWVMKAAVGFRDNGYIQAAFSSGSEKSSGIEAKLTGDGLAEVEELKAVEEKTTAAKPLFDVAGLDDTLADYGGVPVVAVPASDRTVTLDHNSTDHLEVVDTLQNLKQAIESNNEYRSSDIEDHERRLTDVESTLKLLENKRVNVNTMKAVAFGTLAYLVEKFAEHPIGELAKAAWDGLKALLGIG
jgi:hypothetical protein